MDKLYINIKNARLNAGLSQKELADKLGYKSASAIARIENGDNDIPLAKVKAFAKVLDVPASSLMGWDENGDDYHIDKETALLVRQLHDKPELKTVMNSTRKLSKEAVEEVQKFIEYQLEKEKGKK